MADIKVEVVDKTKLRLLEDAKAGDIIDLSTVTRVDTDFITRLINLGLENSYKEQLENTKKSLEREYDAKIEALKQTNLANISRINKENSETLSHVKETQEDTINSLKLRINSLTDEINKNKELFESNVQVKVSEAVTKANDASRKEIDDLKLKLAEKEVSINNLNDSIKDKLSVQKLTLESEFKEEISKISAKKDEISRDFEEYKREKNVLNVKLQGENLERWCNEEFINARLAGFENCDWYKDNDSVKDDMDSADQATKADYIFKMYTDNNFVDSNLITSVCLEMKSRNPLSNTKNTNKSHYKKLDQDRNKKNCEYALLVSELEIEGDNDAPIRKIPGYEKMYMVRPQYMITFLSIIYALSKQYRSLILSIKENDEELKDISEINNEFEELKTTYLDKPLIALNNQINGLKTKSDKIIGLAKDISDEADKIVNETLTKIMTKIDTFTVKKDKLNRKISKLN